MVFDKNISVWEELRPSHTEAVQAGGRSTETYGLSRAKVGGSSRGPYNWNVIFGVI